MRKNGFFAEVAYGADQAWEFFMNYLNNTVDEKAQE
jgi:hypothetical protein